MLRGKRVVGSRTLAWVLLLGLLVPGWVARLDPLDPPLLHGVFDDDDDDDDAVSAIPSHPDLKLLVAATTSPVPDLFLLLAGRVTLQRSRPAPAVSVLSTPSRSPPVF